MADDVASLGLTVDSSGLDKGSEKLKQFSKDADSAAKSADGFNAKTSAGAKASTEQAAGYDKVTAAVSGMSNAQIGAATIIGGLTVAAGAAAVAAGVMAYEWSTAQGKIEQSLIGIGARTGSTIASINKFSSDNATATGLSVDQARDAAIAFTKTGDITVGQLKGLGDAVYGFSVLTGQNATKASQTLAKALSGDLVKGAQELNQTYGFLNPALEDNIRLLVNQGDRMGAVQLIINAMADDNKKAKDSVDLITKAWDGLKNAASAAKNAIGSSFFPNDEQKRAQAANLKNSPETKSATDRGVVSLFSQEDTAAGFDAFQKQQKATQQSAQAVTEAIFPQIKAIQDLEAVFAALGRAQDEGGGNGNNGAAQQAIQNQLNALRESQAEAVRYNEQVAAISQSWGNVGQSTALALNSLQNLLPVAETWTSSARMLAQEQATINDLLSKGKTLEEATALAGAQYDLSKASAVANAQKLVQSSQDNLDKINAQGTSMEGVVASSIAYRDAIAAGATSTQAAAIAANTLAANMAQAAKAAAQAQQSIDSATASYNAQQIAAGQASGTSSNPLVMPKNQLSFSSDPSVHVSYSGGGGGVHLQPAGFTQALFASLFPDISATTLANTTLANGAGGVDSAIAAIQKAGGVSNTGSSVTDSVSALQTLYGIKNNGADNATQITNDQQFLSWLQGQPQTVDNLKAMSDLTNEIKNLATATGSNTSATIANSDLLSPYYTQDPRTSHIGFRSQGMATGGDITIPGGYSANDNMTVTVPVASGEILSVRRPGQTSSGGGGGTTINVSMPITVAGNASKDDFGRTAYQAAQGAARQLAAATR